MAGGQRDLPLLEPKVAEGGDDLRLSGMAAPRQTSKEEPRPSVKDVARAAGVSVGTVSNVFNNPERVSAQARSRVERAINELGYVRNAYAQALRSGVTPLVGVAVLDLTNPFFMEAASAVDARLSEDGCIMVLSSTQADPDKEARLLQTFSGQGVRGILLTPTDDTLSSARELAARGVKVVLFDTTVAPPDMSSVGVDDERGAELAIRHLLDLGHRRIEFVNGPINVMQARDRLAGVQSAMRTVGSEGALRIREAGAFTSAAGRELSKSIVAELCSNDGTCLPAAERSTAVFCANDMLALGVFDGLRDAGISIPGDLSLVGFDDSSVAAQTFVPLTTIRQPMRELGWTAADILLSDDDAIRHERFSPQLVVRKSSAAPRTT